MLAEALRVRHTGIHSKIRQELLIGGYMVTFTITGTPQGKARPRFRRVGNFVQTYTPKATKDYEERIREGFLETGCPMFTGAVHMMITAAFTPAKSFSKKKRAELMQGKPTIKCDADNLAKVVMDALNGVAYEDDKQVTALSVFKIYKDEPYIAVVLKEDE